MNCNRCNRELSEDERYVYDGKVFCEDCLMKVGLTTKECDPWATFIETSGRKRHGETGAAGLNETGTKIYELVKSKGKVTRKEVMESLGLNEPDLTIQLVPLMHADLVKELGFGDNMYLVAVK